MSNFYESKNIAILFLKQYDYFYFYEKVWICLNRRVPVCTGKLISIVESARQNDRNGSKYGLYFITRLKADLKPYNLDSEKSTNEIQGAIWPSKTPKSWSGCTGFFFLLITRVIMLKIIISGQSELGTLVQFWKTPWESVNFSHVFDLNSFTLLMSPSTLFNRSQSNAGKNNFLWRKSFRGRLRESFKIVPTHLAMKTCLIMLFLASIHNWN